MNKNYELGLYKILMIPDIPHVSEFGWVKDKEFFVWVDFSDFEEFIKELTGIFGRSVFDEGRFNANIQPDSVCIDLCSVLGGYVDIEKVFPKDKFRH